MQLQICQQHFDIFDFLIDCIYCTESPVVPASLPVQSVIAAGYFSSEILALLSRLPVSLFGQHAFLPACPSVFNACLARQLICLFRLYQLPEPNFLPIIHFAKNILLHRLTFFLLLPPCVNSYCCRRMRVSTYEKTVNPYQSHSQQVTYLIRICCYDPLTTDLIFIRAIWDKLGVAGSKMTLIIVKSSVTGSC
jgi:hypothetical protein